VRLSARERRMKCTNATNFHRKSGVAKWRDLLFILRSIESEWRIPSEAEGSAVRPSVAPNFPLCPPHTSSITRAAASIASATLRICSAERLPRSVRIFNA
jgi:hypothetical protein